MTESGGLKFDDGKIPTELLSTEALRAVTCAHSDPDIVEATIHALASWYAGTQEIERAAAACLGALAIEIDSARSSGAWLEVAKVLAFGAKKYAPWNWEKGLGFTRVYAAALRHLFQHQSGETHDQETGLLHLAHAMCEIMFLCAYTAQGRADLDDRRRRTILPPPSPVPEPKAAPARQLSFPFTPGYSGFTPVAIPGLDNPLSTEFWHFEPVVR